MAIHFVVKQQGGREMPVCHPEGLPPGAIRDMWTRVPERVTCEECLAIMAGEAATMNARTADGGAPA